MSYVVDTKAPITDGETSDTLGVSCVIVNDLKQRRQRDYEFSWDRVLQVRQLPFTQFEVSYYS